MQSNLTVTLARNHSDEALSPTKLRNNKF